MSTPRAKRQFAGAAADPAQRQITSFFALHPSGDGPPAPRTPEPPRQPALPASVQANLLTVGMRVRKSVPEGYKTAGPSAFKLWTDNTKPSPSPAGSTATTTAVRSASRELLPFCGINKVGGLDIQPEFQHDEDQVPALDDVPELTMSQESAADSEPSRKRTYDEDNDGQDLPAQLRVWDGELSPRSLAPAGWGNARAMAVPRSRIRKSGALQDVGQENMAIDEDFEDAKFLVFG